MFRMVNIKPRLEANTKPQMNMKVGRQQDEKAELQARLAASEGWFQGLIEHMADGLIVFDGLGDGDFQITYANQQAGAIFGYAADQLGGLDYLTLVHPNDRERIAARKRLASLGAPVGVETYRALRSDGEVIWLTTRSRVFAHGPSCPRQTCVATSVRDVTEGREQEVALIEARSRIDHILNIVPGVFYHVVYGKDDGDRQAFVSENVADWFGVSHEEASRPGFL